MILPDGWLEVSLEEIVDILDSQRAPLNSNEREKRISGKSTDQLFPYYGATGQVGYVDDYIFDESLVLLGEDGVPFLDPLRQKAYRVEGKCWVNNHAHVLRAKSEVSDGRYIASYLNSFDYTGFVSGTTRLKLTQAAMRTIPVPLPPLNEQKRIADKLDALLAQVDACSERLDQIPKIIKRFRQAVLVAATTGALTEKWREDQEEKLKWEKTRIGDLLAEKPRNGYSPKAVGFQTNTRSLTLSATTSGRFNPSHSKYINEDIPKNSYLWLAPGDILIQRANTIEYVGVSAIYDGPVESFIYPDLMMKCRPNDKVLTKYLYYMLSSEPIRNYFRENATGTAGNMPKINQQTVLSAPAVVPKLFEQHEIVRRVETLFAFTDRLEARCAAVRTQVENMTPALLVKSFCGELVSQDPNDEPASKLLVHIREQNMNQPELKRKSRIKITSKERHMNTKTVTTLDELVAILDQLGGKAMAEILLTESGLSGDVDRFFELIREGRNKLLDVPVGSNKPIRRVADANQ